MTITPDERRTLRELAKRQAEIAALPVMAERERLWYGLNGGDASVPLVTMEFHGLSDEVYPRPSCVEPLMRGIERRLANNIYKYENFRDDRVIAGYVKIPVPNRIVPFGRVVETVAATNADGSAGMAYRFKHIINDLYEDREMIRPSPFYTDAGLARFGEIKAVIDDVIGDILPVKPEFPSFLFDPPHIFCAMMGMETMFRSICDYPELFHAAMRRLTDDYHAYIDALEAGGAILANNDGSSVSQDSYGYTRDLPDPSELGRPCRLSDVWGYSNSQETVGMSPAMFDEFFFSYIKEIADRCGLMSYGCCEPVDAIWEPCLMRLTNLRKLSISPWCDEEKMGEALRGAKICYHRKPSPNFISVDETFDEDAFLAHIKKTVTAARGCPLEITFRDITSVRGEPRRLTRAVELTREAFARWWKG